MQTKTSISTRTRFFDFNDPESFKYDIEEIAHALSHLCRYTGHVHSFYSVAEHSVLCSLAVDPKYALEALLHDASEAFCGDVNKPLKTMLPEYSKIEERVQASIAKQFGLVYPFPEQIHAVDAGMYWLERESIAKSEVIDTLWNKEYFVVNTKINGWSPYMAKKKFIARYEELTNDRHGSVYGQGAPKAKAA